MGHPGRKLPPAAPCMTGSRPRSSHSAGRFTEGSQCTVLAFPINKCEVGHRNTYHPHFTERRQPGGWVTVQAARLASSRARLHVHWV